MGVDRSPSRRFVASGLAASVSLAACGGASLPRRRVSPPAHGSFPLRLEAGKRYLTSAQGAPFLLHGDTAWSLIAQCSREQVAHYLDDRQSRGFNAILVNLVEHKFATNAPANFYGEAPFLTPNDFSTPNENYFAYADEVIEEAQRRDILVLLAPAYLGYEGGDEGWYSAMLENGGGKLRAYGRYLAERYARFGNILWVNGADYNPPNRSLTRGVAQGVRDVLPWTLQTAHCERDTAALDFWRRENWLSVNTTYISDNVVERSLVQYRQPEAMPFFLIEARYENSPLGVPATLRAQAYGTLLSGGCGHLYGNADVWHYDGPGIIPPVTDWQTALDSPGAHDMSIFKSFFSALRWDMLAPDLNDEFLVNGRLDGNSRAAVSLASDGSFGLIYAPDQRTLTVDLARLSGESVRSRWFDPTNGAYAEASGSPFTGRRTVDFAVPARNAAGQADWVLLLEPA